MPSLNDQLVTRLAPPGDGPISVSDRFVVSGLAVVKLPVIELLAE